MELSAHSEVNCPDTLKLLVLGSKDLPCISIFIC